MEYKTIVINLLMKSTDNIQYSGTEKWLLTKKAKDHIQVTNF